MVDCFEMRVHEELTRIWQILYGNLSAVPRIPILNKEATQQIRIQKMLTYIHRNYMHPLRWQASPQLLQLEKVKQHAAFGDI